LYNMNIVSCHIVVLCLLCWLRNSYNKIVNTTTESTYCTNYYNFELQTGEPISSKQNVGIIYMLCVCVFISRFGSIIGTVYEQYGFK